MHFGVHKRSTQERILDTMLDNQMRDPEVNLKSILGKDELVLNFRPNDKSKHLGLQHVTLKAHTEAQRMMDEALLYRKSHLADDDQGLPPVSTKVAKYLKKTNKLPNISSPSALKDYVESTPMDPGSPKKSKQITLGNLRNQGNSNSRQNLIPFRNLHQKTHFRTIEHLMAKCEPKAQYERIPSPLPEISLARNGSNQSLKSLNKV